MAKSRLKKGCAAFVVVVLAIAGAAIATFAVQGARVPAGPPDYVALGSSFAAGAGLGALQPRSPTLCARSINGYPQQLARARQLRIVDMSCGGAKTTHLIDGGQFFQGPQVRAIAPGTRLVTVTVGGNDIGYIGDMSLLAARNSHSLFGWLTRQFWGGPNPLQERNFGRLERELTATLRTIRSRAPQATMIVATYPAILPPSGSCANVGLTGAEARMMRDVANRLAAVTRMAAQRTGAVVVDMNAIGAAHHACAAEPWVAGWANAGVAPFHPNRNGAKATADAISKVLDAAGPATAG